MTATIDRGTNTTKSPATRGRRPKLNFETWQWFFMRISGLMLVVLALMHFTITHIVHDVADTNLAFVQQRWKNPVWRAFDWLLLTLALFHGLNGLRVIIDDYVRAPAKRALTKAVIYTLAGTLFTYGTIAILTYSPRLAS